MDHIHSFEGCYHTLERARTPVVQCYTLRFEGAIDWKCSWSFDTRAADSGHDPGWLMADFEILVEGSEYGPGL